MRRLRALSEAECYFRCYGASDESVRVFRLPARERGVARRSGEARPSGEARLSGERLRLLFERRLDARQPGLAA
jgi:hypothetical protein